MERGKRDRKRREKKREFEHLSGQGRGGIKCKEGGQV